MKVTQTPLSPPPSPVFVPQQVIIELETQDEARAFYHLVGCWDFQFTCNCRGAVGQMADAIKKNLKPPIHL